MEKTLDTNSIIDENEKLIANILHDIKSPLYSIKLALQTKLDNELNKDIFKITLNTIEYIENFLINYSFSKGKYNIEPGFCNVKKMIEDKIESYKYIFIEKNIHIDFIISNDDFFINSNEMFLSSILGNIISNIAFHASKNKTALIELNKKGNFIIFNFKNYFDEKTQNSNLGLNFSKKFVRAIKACLKFKQTKNTVEVELKVPNLKAKSVACNINC